MIVADHIFRDSQEYAFGPLILPLHTAKAGQTDFIEHDKSFFFFMKCKPYFSRLSKTWLGSFQSAFYCKNGSPRLVSNIGKKISFF